MRDLSETDEDSLDLASLQCLTRTRSGVLNVLMGVGVVVALSGLILRSRPAGALAGNPTWLSQAMLMVLFGVFVVSTVLRRVLGRRTRLRDPRSARPAVPRGPRRARLRGSDCRALGLAHGWLVSPRLEAVIPFWVVALLLGILAYPRARELEGFGQADDPLRRAGLMTSTQTTIVCHLCPDRRNLAHPLAGPQVHSQAVGLSHARFATLRRGKSSPCLGASFRPRTRRPTLADCLASVCRQNYPSLEILVIDDRSTDRTAAIARDFATRDDRVRRAPERSACRRDGPARPTFCSRPPPRPAATGSGSSTPIRCTPRSFSASCWSTPGPRTRRW